MTYKRTHNLWQTSSRVVTGLFKRRLSRFLCNALVPARLGLVKLVPHSGIFHKTWVAEKKLLLLVRKITACNTSMVRRFCKLQVSKTIRIKFYIPVLKKQTSTRCLTIMPNKVPSRNCNDIFFHDSSCMKISKCNMAFSRLTTTSGLLKVVSISLIFLGLRHLLMFITRKYTIINANLKLVNAKMHSFYSIDIH